MCFFFSLVPMTVLIVIGYFVLLSSNLAAAAGGVRSFGRILAVWVFLVALLFPTMGTYLTASGLCPVPRVMQELGAR
jgi:hypothetical protein